MIEVPSKPARSAAAPFLNKKVLIIDDDRPIRRMISLILQLDGFQTLDAASAAEGMSIARSSRPDLVICDVIMDTVDGYSALEAFRSQAEFAAVPFILMTGMANNDGLRRGMKLGADDYLAKPFSGEELRETVAALMRKQARAKELTERRMAQLRANINVALPHELLTPLNGIMGFAELLRTAGNETPNPVRQEMAASICESAERLQRLIENYLIFAQIELLASDEEKLRILREAVCEHASQVVSDTANGTARRFERHIDIRFRLEKGAPRISEEHLKRIVEELISNACKFSKTASALDVVCWNEKGKCIFAVRDNGHGMSEEQISQVGAFMQFNRHYYEQQGLGLGLVISRRLAELHGGELRIMSKPGMGTEVVVSLPSAEM